MAAFNYRASTLDGKIVEGTMEAADGGAVALKLQEMGLLPVQVGATAAKSVLSREIEWPWKRRRLRTRDVLVFTSELHTLVKSGIPLDRSLAVLADLAESPQLGEVVREVLKEIKGGRSLSEGLGKHPEVFPKIYVNMVRAGEVGGFLEEVLARLAKFMEMSEGLRSYIATALAYPILLSAVGLASVTILTLFVVPRFATIFQGMNVPMPLPMVILTGISDVIGRFWWLLLAGGAGAVYSFRRFRQSPEGRLSWDRWLLRIPLLGEVLRKIEVARFTRTLGTLLHSGVPLLEAMSIVREIVGNQGIATMIEPIRAGIKKGEGISQPMKQSGVFPPLAMHLVEVGEETGRLDAMLAQVADVYDEDVRHSVKGLISFFEPALILVMGIIIGTIVVSMLLAIFSINDVPL